MRWWKYLCPKCFNELKIRPSDNNYYDCSKCSFTWEFDPRPFQHYINKDGQEKPYPPVGDQFYDKEKLKQNNMEVTKYEMQDLRSLS